MRPIAMTIAGSDSGGGAGIQADLATFFAHGVYGASVITALTAQNTVTVAGVHPAPAEFVALQIRTVLEDIPVRAAKTGMLFDAQIIRAVANEIRAAGLTALVLDPVMIAKSGDALLRDDAVQTLIEELIPLALCVTPNIPEAERLADMEIQNVEDMKIAAERIAKMGPPNVVVKGGHMEGGRMLVDVAFLEGKFMELERERIDTKNTHGTGCTFSAAITAGLAQGKDMESAVKSGWNYIGVAIKRAWPLGRGHGPVERFF
ncbi:MAG: bifunctional hydroxymethylpyrimidine kinase/phosphomethylpyrimidine kinase [Nitrospinota bacterium]|nr:bifunctional hydroxymethylpyrimidine kinase/phosphomethylpyrimidine kinase [Nitrospinota bacterium]MDH5757612.1 bifunctional hydroxymethylpyrimidine kinase/phosphomethylpyrimidine kinase [Nitrospinota bacterium]